MSESSPAQVARTVRAGGDTQAPTCSVIVPLYNKARHIRQTLETVRAQSFGDFEVIVVDDGSTDDGAAVVAEFFRQVDDPRLQLVRQSNAGVSSARNLGLRQARGRYLFFLDADDLWHRDQLRAVVDTFERNPGALLVGSSYRMVSGDVTDAAVLALPTRPLDEIRRNVELVDDLAARWLSRGGQGFNSSTAAIRATALSRVSEWFPEDFCNGEDLDFWFRLNELGPFVLIDAELAVIGVDADASVSRVNRQSEEFPPYLRRMAERAQGQRLRGGLNRSWMRFANHYESSIAISKLLHGHRRPAIRLLSGRWRAASSPMWWAAWAMCLMPLPLVRRLRRVYGDRNEAGAMRGRPTAGKRGVDTA